MNPSEKFLQQLRAGELISEENARLVNQWPEIDLARRLVREADRDKLLGFSASGRQPLNLVAITLLQPFAAEPHVYGILKAIWAESRDYDTRYAVLWRLLDNPHLLLSLHKEIFAFIRNDWPRFFKAAGRWYGKPVNIIPGVRARLKDPTFPQSKAWVYLCVALSSPDTESARQLVADYVQSTDSFLAEVANVCRARLAGEILME
jgi:hypothetical protein